MARLTKTLVDSLKGGGHDYFEWDDLLPGFGVRIWPTGRKVYVAQYRAGGRTRRVKIGTHGPLTVEEARREAKGILGEVARGEDPQEDRITRRKSLTVAELCARYLTAVEKGVVTGKGGRPKKAASIDIERGRIDRHIKPLLGNRLVIDLKSADVARFIKDVTLGKTATVEKTGKKRGKAIVEGGAGTAGRTAGLLGGIFAFAVDEGVIEANPCHGVKRPAIAKRTRRLTADEYKRLEAAIRKRDNVDPWQGHAGLRLLALTGCRLGEIKNLKWSEVDLDGQALRLVDSKTGPSTRPMGQPVVVLLRSLAQRKVGDYVLPGARDAKKPFGALPATIKNTVAAAELEGVTAHTLRHSFASVAGDLDFAESTIGTILGHSQGSTTSRYIHKLDSVLIAAANRIASEVHRQMTGAEAKVVSLPSRKRKA